MMEQSVRINLQPEVAFALERLCRAGFSSYVVGGCVRDSILGRCPNDWDITTAATPQETAKVFADFRTVETGIRHGTLTVLVNGVPLEITTFRNDGEYADHRHPVCVRFSRHLKDDLARRDFTVNAMAYHPDEGLIDLFGGQEDLRRGVIRCVGEPAVRFDEDGLRILRAIRFASVLDFTVDAPTSEAVHRLSGLLDSIARERVREELFKLLTGAGAARVLREYADVIACVLPEIRPAIGFPHNSKYHSLDVWEHTLRAIEVSSPWLLVRLSLLFHDLGKPHTKTEDAEGWHFKGHAKVSVALAEAALARLATDRATSEAVLQLVEWHDREILPEARSVKRLMRRMSDENIAHLMEIKRADRIAHAKGYDVPSPSLAEILRLVEQIRESNECLSLRTLAIGGDALLSMGIPRGKVIGEILCTLLDRVIDGELPNDAERLLAEARQLWDAQKK